MWLHSFQGGKSKLRLTAHVWNNVTDECAIQFFKGNTSVRDYFLAEAFTFLPTAVRWLTVSRAGRCEKTREKRKKKNLAETETQPHLKALCVGLLVIADFHNEHECRRQKGFFWKSAVGGSHRVWYEEVGLISDLLKSGQLRWRWRLHALHQHSGTCKCTADSEGHFWSLGI